MTFPLRYSVGHHAYSTASQDEHGNDVPVFTPALDRPGTPRKVYGWSTPDTTEPPLAGHDRVIVDVELLVPEGFPAKPRDVIDLPAGPSGQFEVVGEVRDYNHGPFAWRPGSVVNLRRVDG